MNLTTTWTSNRDINWGNFAPVMFYDGQGFMTYKDTGIESALELEGAAICVTAGTTTELNLADYFRQNDLNFTPTVYEQSDVAFDAYLARQCDAFTTDRSGLASLLTQAPNPEDHVILPEIVSEEPLTPVVPMATKPGSTSSRSSWPESSTQRRTASTAPMSMPWPPATMSRRKDCSGPKAISDKKR